MADEEPDMEVGPTCTAEELAAQRYEAAKANGDVLELSSDDEDEPPAKPQTPVKQPRRSRLDDVTFGADGRARDTHTPQRARKRRQIVISDDDESEDDEEEDEDDDESEEDEVVFVAPPPRKKRRSTPAPGVTVAQLKDRCRARGLKVGGTKSELLARLMSPSAEDQAGYRAPRPLKANARTQYFVDGRRVSKSQFDRSQGYGGFAAAMSQHRAAEAQHRALEAQHRALMAQSRQLERMFRGGFPW